MGGVCLRSRKIFSALFSRNNFFTRRGHFKELQVNGNLFDCTQVLTVAGFTYKQQKCLRIFYFKILFFSRTIFARSIHIFLILFQKCSGTFHWNWIWQIADMIFSALVPKRRNTLQKRKIKFALTGNAQKVIWVLAFRSREKFDNSIFLQNFWYSPIASPVTL